MAKREGGGGGFGWLVLGIIIGVIAILAVQFLGRRDDSDDDDASSARPVVVAPATPQPAPSSLPHSAKAERTSKSTPYAPPSGSGAVNPPVAAQDPAQMAEDAAAAGMTSRPKN